MTKHLTPNQSAAHGDRTMIYQDPITRQKPEGPATLVQMIRRDDDDGLNRWAVRFDGEDCTFERTVFVGD